MRWAYLAFLLILSVTADDDEDSCPKVKGQDLDINKFSGKWFIVEKTDNRLAGRCLSMIFTLNENGDLDISRKAISIMEEKPFTVEGKAVQDKKEKYKLTTSYKAGKVKTDVWLLESDYKSTAMFWTCKNGTQNAWLLARKLEPEESVVQKANEVLEKNGLNITFMKKDARDDCNERT